MLAVSPKRLNEVNEKTVAFRARRRRLMTSRRTQALLAAAGEVPDEQDWYVLVTAGGADKAVDNALDEAGVGHWMPVKRVVPPRRPGRCKAARPAYDKTVLPGYIFVATPGSIRAFDALRGMDGVRGVLGTASGPVAVSDEKLTKLRVFVDQDPEALAVLTQAIRRGDRVSVDDGPFMNFPGLVEAVAGGRALIEVMLFGRTVPMTLDLAQITKIG